MMWLNPRLVDSSVYFCLCVTEKQFKEKLKYLKFREELSFVNCGSDATTHYFERKGKTTAIVCFKDDASRVIEQNIALLVHEAVHIWQQVRELIGEHSPSKEFEAYSVQSITQELLRCYFKNQSKRVNDGYQRAN